jgi:acetyl-CoA C-acetyltransferase
MQRYGMSEQDMARVTVKNRRHAALNPKAHLRRIASIDDVLASRIISWPIKLLDCCPQSSGAAAMMLASERFIRDNHP